MHSSWYRDAMNCCLGPDYPSFSRRYENSDCSTQDELRAQRYLINHLGDMTLNARLQAIPQSLRSNTQNWLITFTYRTRRLDSLRQVIKKFEGVEDMLDLDLALRAAPKAGWLTVRELGALDQTKRWGATTIASLRRFAGEHIDEINEYRRYYRRCCEIVDLIDQASVILDSPYRAGDLSFRRGDALQDFLDHRHGAMQTLIDCYGRPYDHVAFHGDGAYTVDLMVEGIEKHDAEELGVISETYRLRLPKLLTKEGLRAARKLGTDWEEQLDELYHEIAGRLAKGIDEGDLGPLLENPTCRWLCLGPTSRLPGGHSSLVDNHYRDIANRLVSPREEASRAVMLCSEFAMLLTIASLLQLESRLGGGALIQLPLSKHERLETLMPGRLRQLLLEADCIQRIPLPEPFDKLLQLKPTESGERNPA